MQNFMSTNHDNRTTSHYNRFPFSTTHLKTVSKNLLIFHGERVMVIPCKHQSMLQTSKLVIAQSKTVISKHNIIAKKK